MKEQLETRVSAEDSVFRLSVREIWSSRDMLLFLVLRDFKIRFKQSALGLSWAVLQPLLTTVVFTLVVGKVMQQNFDGPYALFFLAGLIPWNYFSKVFGNGTTSLVVEADLIRKVYFPRLILPLSQALSVMTDVIISLFIFALLCLWYGWAPGPQLLTLPFFLFLTLLFATSFSLWLGPINVRFRDIQIALPLLTQLLFIASPVMYPLSTVKNLGEGWFFTLYRLNPICGLLEGFRYALVGKGDPFAPIHMVSWIIIVVFFVGGMAFFNGSQRRFADVI